MKIFDIFAGLWKGYGTASYPTIKSVEYKEELRFEKNVEFPVLHYEQKTWVKGEDNLFNVPIFWESGFLIDKGGNNVELCNSQKSGRMEILTGQVNEISDGLFEIIFNSKAIYNDERMIKSGRRFLLSKKKIEYELWMSTNSNPRYDIHLKAVLEKET